MVATLTVWENDYGVPSIDTDSLIIITYIRLAKINCTIQYGRTPILFDMPRLYVEDEVSQEYVGFDEIWEYLRNQVLDLDHYMQGSVKADIYAYTIYLRNSLMPGILATTWIDKQNYLEVTRKWYRNALMFPFNFLYPYLMYRRVQNYVHVLSAKEEEDILFTLIEEGKKCLNDLSWKLGENKYFLGNSPTSIDAVLYGYLAPLLNVPVLSIQLQTYLKERNNLVNYVARINRKLFPEEKIEYKYAKKVQTEDELQDVATSTRTIVFAAIFAASAMISFGMSIGIVRIPSDRT